MSIDVTREIGELILVRYDNHLDLRLHIERADPLVRITADLLEEIEQASQAWRDDMPKWLNPTVRIVDDVVTIFGDTRTVVYRIVDDSYEAQTDTYLMEWPD